jgi:hypothetical protein
MMDRSEKQMTYQTPQQTQVLDLLAIPTTSYTQHR